MNNFLNNALGFVRDYAYQSMGGKEFAAAQRRNARVQRERGLLGSYMDPKYWSQIAKGTGKAALNVLPGAALKAAGGVVRSTRAANQLRRGITPPPAVATTTRLTSDKMADVARKASTKFESTPYYADDYAARSAAQSKAIERAQRAQSTRAANAARQQSIQAQRDIIRAPFTAPSGILRTGASAATVAGTGAAAATLAPKPKPTPKPVAATKTPKVVQAASGKKKKSGRA